MAQVPAAKRTVALLRYLAQHSRPVTAASIARDLRLPRSTAYHLLAALEEARFVTHLPEEQRWTLGVAAFELGSAYLRSGPLERLARPLLHRLAHSTGLSAHLAVLDGRDVVYLAMERPPLTFPLVVDVGVRLPAHLTASGRALLAEQSTAQIHATYPDRASLANRTEVGPRSPRDLRRLLERCRDTGFGMEVGEIDPKLSSVAAVAHDHAGRAVAAVTLTFPSSEYDDASRIELAQEAASAAGLLTERLGGERA